MTFEKPPGQKEDSLDPRDYYVRVIVAGTRGYDDRVEFHNVMCAYIKRFEGTPILFISGAATTGADDLIIRWCKKYGYPCLKMPADWDTFGKGAGFVRNGEMARVGTHLVEFWDGKSPGSADMIDKGTDRQLIIKIINIKTPIPKTKK